MGSETTGPIVIAAVIKLFLQQRRCQAFPLRFVLSPAEVQSFNPGSQPTRNDWGFGMSNSLSGPIQSTLKQDGT